MGSNLTNGAPTVPGKCTVRYDNLGYVFGTSSDVFFAACSVIEPANSTASLANTLEGLVDKAHDPVFFDLFGVYPNPFYKYQRASQVQDQPVLTMVDGGATLQSKTPLTTQPLSRLPACTDAVLQTTPSGPSSSLPVTSTS
jgi:lysophospholipase